jgi:hypothetical protein
MIHVPYKSGAAGATDLMGGQVEFMFEQMYAAMPSIKGGKLRALAITSAKRSPLLPDCRRWSSRLPRGSRCRTGKGSWDRRAWRPIS